MTLLIVFLAVTNMAIGYGLAVYLGNAQQPIQITLGSFRKPRPVSELEPPEPVETSDETEEVETDDVEEETKQQAEEVAQRAPPAEEETEVEEEAQKPLAPQVPQLDITALQAQVEASEKAPSDTPEANNETESESLEGATEEPVGAALAEGPSTSDLDSQSETAKAPEPTEPVEEEATPEPPTTEPTATELEPEAELPTTEEPTEELATAEETEDQTPIASQPAEPNDPVTDDMIAAAEDSLEDEEVLSHPLDEIEEEQKEAAVAEPQETEAMALDMEAMAQQLQTAAESGKQEEESDPPTEQAAAIETENEASETAEISDAESAAEMEEPAPPAAEEAIETPAPEEKPASAEADVLAGIEAFRSQLAKMQEGPAAAAESEPEAEESTPSG